MVQRVAVIGGGAAGLCALRHLTARPEQFQAVAFEQNSRVGGTWIYTTNIGKDENGLPVFSSMYKNLRTNLPKEVMAFPDFPFKKGPPSFISHEEVLQYLEDYAIHYKLYQYIKFQTIVQTIRPLTGDNFTSWEVTYCPVKERNQSCRELFDAVIICNGHYSVPLYPDIVGLKDFAGHVIHSHDYREPESYTDLHVVCLGAAASGQDISMDIALKAKQVYLSHDKPFLTTDLPSNVEQRPGIKCLRRNSVIFNNSEEVEIDALILCTGYRYSFPFLTEECNLRIEEERITPLYKHLIHTQFHTLSFIGICKTICPFPQFHSQVRFVLSVLNGSLMLPSREVMDHDTERDYQTRLEEGLPARHAHTLGPLQWNYNDDLSSMAKFEPIPRVVQELYDYIHHHRKNHLSTYKDMNYELIDDKTFKPIQSCK
ncbi:hypothetical protein CHS0354_029605 [Potamilus streckersoni]|uniref:Flavin-containing monooxygenase n=1 Tax=Potamilus streckersoni TaxID=2493646 RepID=A0AAE0RTP6_9BIVA|nr:hypothetical protein CHS0354_029605 [Potamilus streckersoni]